VEGAALLLGRLPPPFPFSVFPFRPGNPGLFGALLQPPEKKKFSEKTSQKDAFVVVGWLAGWFRQAVQRPPAGANNPNVDA